MIDFDLKSEFLSYIAAEKGVAANTRLAYDNDIDTFLEFCAVRKTDPLKVSLRNLRDYAAFLRSRELSQRTIARRVSCLKQFFKFLLREGKIEKDPSELLSVIVKEKRLPKHLSVDEMTKLISAATGVDGDLSVRDRALLELWYASGCRISEIAGLKVQDIDLKEKLIKVFGKGGRERLIPISTDAVEWCKKYQFIRHECVRRAELKEMNIFFLTQNGKGFTRQGIWKLLKKYAKVAGISRNVWPHMIRHSFATHVLRGGADLRAVQAFLGHRTIATTEIYTHLDIENLKVMQQKFHPRS